MSIELKFNEQGLIPAIAQDYLTREVLMMAYMNRESFDKTMETGQVHYFSRSRNELWLKGETSGHFQTVKEIRYDCDCDTLLILVEQQGAACHTEHKSCFYRSVDKDGVVSELDEADSFGVDSFDYIYDVIVDRRDNPKEGSYTNYLFDKGLDKMLKKVGEETAEVIIAAKNQDKREIICEISDLIYHLSVTMVQSGVLWNDISEELKNRRK